MRCLDIKKNMKKGNFKATYNKYSLLNINMIKS